MPGFGLINTVGPELIKSSETTDLTASGVARLADSTPIHRQIFNELHTDTSSEDSEEDE